MEAIALVLLGWVMGVAMTVIAGSMAKACEDVDIPTAKLVDDDTIKQMKDFGDLGYLKPNGETYAVNEDGDWDWLGDPDGWKNR